MINLSRLNGYLIDFESDGISGSVFVYFTRHIKPDFDEVSRRAVVFTVDVDTILENENFHIFLLKINSSVVYNR